VNIAKLPQGLLQKSRASIALSLAGLRPLTSWAIICGIMHCSE